MRRRRKKSKHLCDGPGRLTQALGVELAQDGVDLAKKPLYVSWDDPPQGEILATTRIGISRGTELPWRYLVENESNVSVSPGMVAERGLKRTKRLSARLLTRQDGARMVQTGGVGEG